VVFPEPIKHLMQGYHLPEAPKMATNYPGINVPETLSRIVFY
jgi:hypothetical protein